MSSVTDVIMSFPIVTSSVYELIFLIGKSIKKKKKNWIEDTSRASAGTTFGYKNILCIFSVGYHIADEFLFCYFIYLFIFCCC